MLLHKKRFEVWAVYAVLALLVLAPVLKSGYILTLDMVFTPHFRMPALSSNDYLFRVLLHVLNFVLPGDVIEKILLFVILLLSGVGMHRLVQYLSAKPDRYRQAGAYFAGIFYALNPFTYDRFMAGQYEVLLGYALLPWFTRALLVFLEKPSVRSAVVLAAWAVVASIVSIHAVGLLVILAAIGFSVAAWRERRSERLKKILRYGLLGLTIFCIASSYWLVPLAFGKGNTASTISSFSTADQSAFETTGGNWLGKVGNVLRLQGFWAEARGMYQLPQARVPVWGLLALMIWALVITGAISWWRKRRRDLVLLFGGSMIVAIVLAIGVLERPLAAHVPLFAGYREPEKFVALVALAFAVFAARGAELMLKYCHEQSSQFFLVFAAVLLLLLPIVWTPTMLWGFSGQLRPAQYPSSWFTVNQRLDADHTNFQTLFLPWHLYMYFGFAGRIIANPAAQFFDKPVIVSDNPEFKGAALNNSTPAKRQLDQLLPQASKDSKLDAQLAQLNIKYILLVKDNDYRAYAYLDRQSGLKLVAESATLKLYRNEAWREQ